MMEVVEVVEVVYPMINVCGGANWLTDLPAVWVGVDYNAADKIEDNQFWNLHKNAPLTDRRTQRLIVSNI